MQRCNLNRCLYSCNPRLPDKIFPLLKTYIMSSEGMECIGVTLRLPVIKITTRAHGATFFRVDLPKCEQCKGNTVYRGAVAWNLLPVNQRNIPLYTQFKYIQKKEMLVQIAYLNVEQESNYALITMAMTMGLNCRPTYTCV